MRNKKVLIYIMIGLVFCLLLIRVHITKLREYQANVETDSITFYDGSRKVGTIKLTGALDSLITKDNE